MSKSYFKVTVSEVREVTFLVEAPAGTHACDVEEDIRQSDPRLADTHLENDRFILIRGKGSDDYVPSTEVEAVKLRRKPRNKKPAVSMVPDGPNEERDEINTLYPVPYKYRKHWGGE
jgi:hypothetical protein